MAEINSLKKARSGTTTTKTTKQKAATGKTQVNKKAQPKKTKEQKKKTSEKWAWKNKPPKDNVGKEGNTFIKIFKSKKYYWCLHHNNGAGMWALYPTPTPPPPNRQDTSEQESSAQEDEGTKEKDEQKVGMEEQAPQG